MLSNGTRISLSLVSQRGILYQWQESFLNNLERYLSNILPLRKWVLTTASKWIAVSRLPAHDRVLRTLLNCLTLWILRGKSDSYIAGPALPVIDIPSTWYTAARVIWPRFREMLGKRQIGNQSIFMSGISAERTWTLPIRFTTAWKVDQAGRSKGG